MLPSQLLTDYVRGFFGFGRWEATVWFFGIEEAGGHSQDAIYRRLQVWNDLGRHDLEHAPNFYPRCGNYEWHGPDAEPQATWKQLIRMLLVARGEPDSHEAITNYQREKLGSISGETCIAELLPLPCPSTSVWPYCEWSEFPWLAGRQAYFAEVGNHRTRYLKERLKEHHPGVVIFYGTTLPGGISLLPRWAEMAGGRFDQVFQNARTAMWRRSGSTCFLVVQHPAIQTDQYFREVGNFLRGQLAGRL